MYEKSDNELSRSDQALLARYRDVHEKKHERLHIKLDKIINPVLRWSVFGVNIFFWIIGLLAMMLGVWAYIQKTKVLKSGTVKSALGIISDIAIVFAFLGFIIFSLAFAGCVGVLRLNVQLLRIFRIVLIAILTIQVIMIIGVVVFATVSLQYIQEFLKKTAIAKYRDDADLQDIVDWIQLELRCCGVSNLSFVDWNANRYFNCTDTNPSIDKCSVPYSCCIAPNDIDENIINTRCAYKVLELKPEEQRIVVWPYGCVGKINSIIKQQSIFAMLGISVYIITFCLVIDVLERLIGQIEIFRTKWFKGVTKHDSIDEVSITDLVQKAYKRKLTDRKAARIAESGGDLTPKL